jgi:hypothetical protein
MRCQNVVLEGRFCQLTWKSFSLNGTHGPFSTANLDHDRGPLRIRLPPESIEMDLALQIRIPATISFSLTDEGLWKRTG